MNRKELLRLIAAGEKFEYYFFWNGPFSQWHRGSPFNIDGITYRTAEHWMMVEKARTFADHEALREILKAPTPGTAKDLGRAVKNYNNEKWSNLRVDAVVRGNMAKFTQNAQLTPFLLDSGDKVLVEASPVDDIWGIKLAAEHPNAGNPAKWQGQNLLGFALMEVRARLRNT